MKFVVLMLLAVLTLPAADAIAFSHKQHAPLKLDCKYCHVTATSGERASYPTASTCMTCHVQVAKGQPEVRKLAALPKETPIEPENSVYMLADFAYFSHARHFTAKINCQKCHGQIYDMAAVEQVLPMTMKACVTCHRETHATTACNKCHELGQ
ncbi:MAG: cytochrome c3 family protein [Acidobacteriaceae bacterium]|nr:cytochrome c3 family protein [Acidobacteriaceae bacterium]